MTHTDPIPPDDTPRHRVGEVAARLGLTLRTLKYYEELGLVTPQRTESRYRLYSEADIARLDRVRRMRALGLSLGTIQATFSQPLELDPDGRQVLTDGALTDLRRDLQRDLAYVEKRLGGVRVGDLLDGDQASRA